jgi:hypothetical protein
VSKIHPRIALKSLKRPWKRNLLKEAGWPRRQGSCAWSRRLTSSRAKAAVAAPCVVRVALAYDDQVVDIDRSN